MGELLGGPKSMLAPPLKLLGGGPGPPWPPPVPTPMKVMISTLRVNNLLITGLIPVPLPVLSTSLVLNKMAVDQN